MAFDLQRFAATFFEEAYEHLRSMEDLLLSLNLAAPDAENLNSIFRSAHSIKGGSATFGFQQLADTTHELETLLDFWRKGQVKPTKEWVMLFLAAGDALRSHVDALRQGTRSHDEQLAQLATKLTAARVEVEGGGLGAAQATPSAAVDAPSGMRTVNITWRSGPRAAGSPDAAALRQALVSLGACTELSLGNGSELSGYAIDTTFSDDDIRDTLGFVVDLDDVDVLKAEPKPKSSGYGLFEVDQPTLAKAVDGMVRDVEPAYGFFDISAPVQEQAKPANATQTLRPASDVPTAAEATTVASPGAVKGDQSSIRVGVDKVDKLINLVGELVIAQAMLGQAVGNLDDNARDSVSASFTALDRNTRELQQAVMTIRMLPIDFVFSRFPRVVYDLSQRLGKQVTLRTFGDDTELDKELIEKIADPLTHLVRNSVDHGIEPPAVRQAKGKDPIGMVMLRATHRGGSVIIEVSDDGAGLNRESIVRKAKERGLIDRDDLTDEEVWELVFAPGLSTADAVTEVSGRGVGMDVVKKNIAALGGHVELRSVKDRGTLATIRLPLTLAILDGMLIAVGDETYVLPLEFVAEAFQPCAEDLKTIAGQGMVVAVRGEHLPVLRMHEALDMPSRHTNPVDGILLVTDVDGKRAAVFVDELVGQQQVVVKSLEANFRAIQGISGATILGDGKIALILDMSAILRSTFDSRSRIAA